MKTLKKWDKVLAIVLKIVQIIGVVFSIWGMW